MSNKIIHQLRSINTRSIYSVLLLVVIGGLVAPAIIGSYLMIGIREQKVAHTALQETLQRDADILSLGLQEPLWVLNPQAASALVESLMRDPAVLRVQVLDQMAQPFIVTSSAVRPTGKIYRAERDIMLHGQRIGHLLVEMDDAKSNQELRAKQFSYVFVLAAQLAVSLLLIILFLNGRLLLPLRKLMSFSDRLSRGDFDTRLEPLRSDELGRLGEQLEHMRIAIKQLFDDVGRREERFRTIVTQVPGAVFRYTQDGRIEFISNTIESICGYPAEKFLAGGTREWISLIAIADRKRVLRHVSEGNRTRVPYEIEYRIRAASGAECWVSENAQPGGNGHENAQWVDGILVDISERKRNEMRIEALLAEQAVILDNVLVSVMFVQRRIVMSANRRFDNMFGYDKNEIVGRSVGLLYATEASFNSIGENAYQTISTGQSYSAEVLYKRRDGSTFWGHLNGCAIDPAQPDNGSIWVIADITERKHAEEKLQLASQVFDHIADGVLVTDPKGFIVAVNQAFGQITGYEEHEVIGRTPAILQSGRQEPAFYASLWAELLHSGFWQGEIWNRHKNGDFYLEWLTISAVRDNDGKCIQYVGVFSDITQVKDAQEKLDHLAHHDALTGLPNRLLFNDRLIHAIECSRRTHQKLALLFIDLDRFKNVNDTLGHHIGDELLQNVARALTERVREGDTLARLGGDEFIMLLENIDGRPDCDALTTKLMSMFEQPFMIADHELFVTCSVGISIYPSDGDDLNMLIRNADVAMYQAKAHGRNAFRFYTPEMTGEGLEKLRLESSLRRSIDHDEILVHYQPQIDIQSGALIGVEALARWSHPEVGMIPPIKFIPMAEDTGFINQLGTWVLLESCTQMMRWQRAGLYVPKIAVNFSVKQFERGGIAELVQSILKQTGLEPYRLQLEVTESVIMNTSDAFSFIHELHAIGVGLAIDDFGTGYSSLAYLKQLPVQTLKIDRSFIKDISTDPNDEAIAIAIIQLGKSLNLSVIAEGVETEQQAAFLLRHGCQFAQGYRYGRPASSQDLLTQWLTLPHADLTCN